jgi:hypothetical protein
LGQLQVIVTLPPASPFTHDPQVGVQEAFTPAALATAGIAATATAATTSNNRRRSFDIRQ